MSFNITFDFPVFSNGVVFSVEFAPRYLTFEVSYTKFTFKLSIEENATHNREQFYCATIAYHMELNADLYAILRKINIYSWP